MNIKTQIIESFQKLLKVYFGKIYQESEMKITEKVIGGKVEFILPDGELGQVPDGEYVMYDGFTFEVKDGLISKIQGQEQESAQEDTEVSEEAVSGDTSTQEVEAEVSEEEVVEEVVVEDPRISEMETKISELESKLSEILQMLSDSEKVKNEEMTNQTKAIEAFNLTVKELNEKISILAKVPVQFSKTNSNQANEESKADKLSVLADIIGRQ